MRRWAGCHGNDGYYAAPVSVILLTTSAGVIVMTSTLSEIRVLDLTDQRGEIAGRMLADLGADVIKIEPTTGAVARTLGPFDSEGNSLYWASYGAGKRSFTVDLDADTTEFLALVKLADVVIESLPVGYMASLGLDYATLSKLNPALIYLSISAYGQQGPKANWPATDLIIEAAGGRLSLQGDTDRAPLPVGFPQAGLHAGAQAAADITIALNEREISGCGQYLDLSMQEAMWWTLMGAQGNPVALGANPPFSGPDRASRPINQLLEIAPASDGLVTISPGGSPVGTRTMFSFAIDEARNLGELDDSHASIIDVDWDNWLALYRVQQISLAQLSQIRALLHRYLSRRTKLQLIDWALENNLRLGPLNSTRDILNFPQFIERDFFKDIGGITQPAEWVKMSRTPLDTRPAPAPSHQPPDWHPRAARSAAAKPRPGNAFDGLKVADFSWVAAGPTVAKALAYHGATVVKVESATRPDLSRTLPPHMDGEAGLNRSYWGYLYATSKLSLQCNLSLARGRQLARQVCDWADVVIESFSPGTMERMGLGYQTLSASHPELIMFSTSMMGQSGPLSHYAGYGQQAAGFCGMHYITGWPDVAPCGVATPYTDVIAPKFGIASLAAALLEHRQSGKGQWIDLSQAECSMMFLAPLLLDEAVNQHTAERAGCDSIYASPHGVYPCAGEERYIAIAIDSTASWRALLDVIPMSQTFHSAQYHQTENRRQQQAEIDRLIASWTKSHDAFELELQLVSTDIPAAVVQRPMDVFNDPQIEARGLKQVLHHGECGDVVHYGFCTHFSAKPQMVLGAPPCIGEHNDYVLRDLLGLSDQQISELATADVLN
jgi:crotonobetainyl-CoA:carnitine CoA-transferase CaiB-like acyl-CoA transferase